MTLGPLKPEHNFIGSDSDDLSPGICASDASLAKFPPTRLILAGVDPLKDDGIFFLHRLLKNKVDASALEMKLMPHGFLSYSYSIKKIGLPQSSECVVRAISILKAMSVGEPF